MELFITIILIGFLLLFLVLSVPMKNADPNETRSTQTMQQVK